MHYNPKNETPDTIFKGVTKGNKIWNVNTEIPQYPSISKILFNLLVYNY